MPLLYIRDVLRTINVPFDLYKCIRFVWLMYHKNLRQFKLLHNDGKVENYRLKRAFNKSRAHVQRHTSGQTQTVGLFCFIVIFTKLAKSIKTINTV